VHKFHFWDSSLRVLKIVHCVIFINIALVFRVLKVIVAVLSLPLLEQLEQDTFPDEADKENEPELNYFGLH
jgi:hypothetical protein